MAQTFTTIEGPGGVPHVRVVAAESAAEIALHGAHLVSWKPHDQEQDVIWMGHYVVAEGKDCWGGVPLCWPWFIQGPDPLSPRRPFHGFGRKMPWRLLAPEVSAEYGAVRIDLALNADDATRQWWPHEFDACLTATVGSTLTMELRTRNTGKEPFILEHCFHAYFQVGDVTRVALLGLDGALRESGGVHQGELPFNGPYAEKFSGTAGPYTIVDPVFARRIVIEKTGSDQTVVWNSGPQREGPHGPTGEAGWQTQLAVEPLRGMSEALQVSPDEEVRLSMTLRTEPI